MTTERIWRQALLNSDTSIGQAIRNLDQVGIQIVLVINQAGILLGTLSDGDIRRGLLKGLDLTCPIDSLIHRTPVVVPPEIDRGTVIQLMTSSKVHQIPVVDEDHKVVGLHLWDEITMPRERTSLFVVMAGGLGSRLRPYTENCPKPMLPIGGKPMLEHILDRAKLEGFRRFAFAINYLGEKIESYFGDGTNFNVEIQYLREESALGTAGALSLLPSDIEDDFLVTNGDVITDIHYGDMLDFHVRHDATATMAVRVHEWQHPFGVVQTKGVEIIGLEEKPVARTHINAGIYALNPTVLHTLNYGQRCDMPELFEQLRLKGERTVAFPMHEPWLDVGRPEDLKQLNREINSKNAVSGRYKDDGEQK